MIPPRKSWFGFVGISLATLILVVGCGGNNSTSVTQPDEGSSQPDESVNSPQTSNPTASFPSGGSMIVERDGRKWIGDVPVDVWYNDPLSVAATSGQVAQSNPMPETQVADASIPSKEEKPGPTTPEISGGIDWQAVIPAELLDAEVTAIRNRFNADLQTVGSYNSSYLGIPPHAVTLAVLSHIATKHPGEIRWKKNGNYIRSLSGQMIAEPLRRGPSSQKPLKLKFENVLEILNGSVPATLEAPPGGESIADAAKVSLIMKRLENCEKLISVNGGTEGAMKENAELLKQEAAVLGALTQVLLDGYEDYEGDEDFAAFVTNMVDASKGMREHIKAEQFDKFELDISKMKKTCTECHSTYR